MQITAIAPKEQKKKKIKVCAYCRVSTDSSEQENSLDNQRDYYEEKIKSNPSYEFVDVYYDFGISGFKEMRPGFQKMIEDAKAGKIDLILTKSIDLIIVKSISRFARNTQDCLSYSRMLKNMGIGVYFEKENVNTLDGAGELLFTILSSLAQEESRSISENCKWGIRKKFSDGKLHLNTNRFLGYDKDEKGNLIINEEQAVSVRRIYTEFMNGSHPDTIAKRLNEEGVPGCMGEAKWACSTIWSILTNEKYSGDAILQKTFTSDFLSKKTEVNRGQITQYHVEDDHEAIIEKDFWQATQQEVKRRKDYMAEHGLRTMGRYTEEQPFSNRVLCGACGHIFWRRTLTRGGQHVKVWMCGQRYRKKKVVGCKSDTITEQFLHDSFVKAWNQMVEHRTDYLDEWKKTAKCDNPLKAYNIPRRIFLYTELTLFSSDFFYYILQRLLEIVRVT